MANTNIGAVTTTDLKGDGVVQFKVSPEETDGISATGESFWDNEDFTKYLAYYKKIPELKAAINGFATWILGKGFATDDQSQTIVDNMKGWGEDNFTGILWNQIVVSLFNGDSYAEIIRNENGTLINLKPLDPASMRTVVNGKGFILRYEQRSKINEDIKKFRPNKIFHLCNDRIADEIHGTSLIEAVQFVIDARNEAMGDKRRVHHNSTIRIIEVDTEDTTKLNTIKKQWAIAIKNGDVLLVPKGNITFPDAPINFIETQEWIRYLEDFLYQTIGVPKSVLGGSGFTEGDAKVSYLSFEPVYTRRINSLESDLWNQLALRITFNKPASLEAPLQQAAQKSPDNLQPNDTTAGVGQ